MELIPLLLSILISYLLGSLSFARILMRILKPGENLEGVALQFPGLEEPYQVQAMGGNTASMKLGSRGGCAVGLLDIFKAFVPTLAFKLLYPDQPYFLVAALMSLIGHNWPVFYRFKGGRGISPFYGGLFGFDPLGGVSVAVVSLLLGMFVLREVMFAYVGGVLLLIPWILITKTDDPLWIAYLVYAVLVNILFTLSMVPEIRQLIDYRKKNGNIDMRASLTAFPMGRQMLKLMDRLGLKNWK